MQFVFEVQRIADYLITSDRAFYAALDHATGLWDIYAPGGHTMNTERTEYRAMVLLFEHWIIWHKETRGGLTP